MRKILSNIKWRLIRAYNNQMHYYLEIHLVDHCNLGCASCTHFSPIAEQWYINSDKFKADLDQLQKIFGQNYVFDVRLMGGEPLLHPQINELLHIARTSLRTSKISLVTNGILIKKMNVSFWETMSENNILIYFSEYPIDMNYKELEEVAKSHGVDVVGLDHNDKSYFGKLPIDIIPGNQNSNFKCCPHGNNEHSLRDGKIYTCMTAANIDVLNKKYNLHLPNENGIDIYSVKNKKQIIRFTKKSVPLCAYCRPSMNTRFLWHRSKRQKEEWLLEREE